MQKNEYKNIKQLLLHCTAVSIAILPNTQLECAPDNMVLMTTTNSDILLSIEEKDESIRVNAKTSRSLRTLSHENADIIIYMPIGNLILADLRSCAITTGKVLPSFKLTCANTSGNLEELADAVIHARERSTVSVAHMTGNDLLITGSTSSVTIDSGQADDISVVASDNSTISYGGKANNGILEAKNESTIIITETNIVPIITSDATSTVIIENWMKKN